MTLDFHCITPRLCQGSFPPAGDAVRRAGFDMLVLCAHELQPPAHNFPGVVVIRAPIDDADREPTLQERRLVHGAAKQAAGAVRRGWRVLVTCAAGRNRSGLVSALALRALTGRSGRETAALVKARRPGALTNTYFERYLAGAPALL